MYVLIYATNTIFLLFLSYRYVLKEITPGVSASMVYYSRFDGGCRRSDRLSALVGGLLEMNPKTTGRSLVKRIDLMIGR